MSDKSWVTPEAACGRLPPDSLASLKAAVGEHRALSHQRPRPSGQSPALAMVDSGWPLVPSIRSAAGTCASASSRKESGARNSNPIRGRRTRNNSKGSRCWRTKAARVRFMGDQAHRLSPGEMLWRVSPASWRGRARANGPATPASPPDRRPHKPPLRWRVG